MLILIELFAVSLSGTGLLLLLVDLLHSPGAKCRAPLRVHTYEDDADFMLDDDGSIASEQAHRLTASASVGAGVPRS
jgi:hypothetical protein